MSKEIVTQFTVGDKEVKSFHSLTISQQFNAHHYFELVIDEDALFDDSGKNITDRYIGKDFTACFGQTSSSDAVFKGLVTELSLKQENGMWGALVLKGYSPTYLLEGGVNHHSFYKKKLEAVVKEVVGYASSSLSLENKPVYQNEIPYMSQYGESNFGFLNRLSDEYGEWFYYDGVKLFFGRPSTQVVVELMYGSDISSLDFSVKVLPAKISHYSYNSQDDEIITASLPKSVDGIGTFAKQALKISDKLYSQPVYQPVAIRTSSMSDLDKYAKIHKERIAANMVQLKGEGDNPLLQIGNTASIKTLKKEGTSSDVENYGDFLITSITHRISGTGSYSNIFEGIPTLNEQIPHTSSKPIAETQIATVKDNKDPKNLGRVRVQMLWQEESNEMTDWLRVLTPDAGGGGDVKKNRGFVFIPEIGDQVAVSFRYNDPNRPFVLGSFFHGKTGSGGNADNQNKSLTTRTGSTIILNDAAHTVTMQTSKGNTIKVDEKSGAVTISSGSNVTINSKNITLNGSESISLLSPAITIGSNEGKKPTDTVTIEGKEISSTAKDLLTLGSKEIKIKADEKYAYSGKEIEGKADSKMILSGGDKLEASSSDSNFI